MRRSTGTKPIGKDPKQEAALNKVGQSEVHLELGQQEKSTEKCKSDSDCSFRQFFEDIENGKYARAEIVDYFESSVVGESNFYEKIKLEEEKMKTETIQIIMNRARIEMDELNLKQEDRLLVKDETKPNKSNNQEIRIFVTSFETLKQVELYVFASETIQIIMNRARIEMDKLILKQEDRLLVKESDGFYKVMNNGYPISAYNILADSVLVIAAFNTLRFIDATMAQAQVKSFVFVSGGGGMNGVNTACLDSMA